MFEEKLLEPHFTSVLAPYMLDVVEQKRVDAPSRAVPGKKSQCTMPETKAVRKIAQNSGRLPYFSSSGGPTTRIIIMLPI